MEDEELNEEVMGDPDSADEVTTDLQHDEVDAGGEQTPEEPCNTEPCAEDYHLQEQIDVLQKQVEGLMSSLSTIIESGATVMESTTPITDSESDAEEPMLYLEDLDYTM